MIQPSIPKPRAAFGLALLTLMVSLVASPAPAEVSESLETEILALNPNSVDRQQLLALLDRGVPAPQILIIRGGGPPARIVARSFGKFLVGMGYPEDQVRSPGSRSFSISPYKPASQIADLLKKSYEQDGLRPIVVGHSQGGAEAVKVLHVIDGRLIAEIAPTNAVPLLLDPIFPDEGEDRSLHLPLVVSVGGRGLTRTNPNLWNMMLSLHSVPNTAQRFVGYHIPGDILGSDLGGIGKIEYFKAKDRAQVRNVEMPRGYSHFNIISTRRLAKSRTLRTRIDRYAPLPNGKPNAAIVGDERNELWAADVWFEIKRAWVLELQRAVRINQWRRSL